VKTPNHPAAHHYLVHALEIDGRFAEAQKHGAVLAKLAPGAPHAIHMSGHGLMRTGRITEAIAKFEEADRAGAAIRAAESIEDAHDWHHSHNLSLLASAYRHEGRMKEAEAVIRRLAEIPALGDDAELDRKDLASFLLSRGRHEEALVAADALVKNRLPEVRAIGHALAGEALLATGKLEDASRRLADAQREQSAIGGELGATRDWMAGLYVQELDLFLSIVDGRQQSMEAPTHGMAAGLIRNHRAMRGPDGWVQALFRLERLATASRGLGDWTLSEMATEAMLEHDPGYAGSHLAQAAIARHQGKNDVARKEEALARKLWPKADTGL
jgi:tetratricopeptide (TPR) repeat protein